MVGPGVGSSLAKSPAEINYKKRGEPSVILRFLFYGSTVFLFQSMQNFMAPEDRGSWEQDAIDRFFGTLLGRKMSLGEEDGDSEEDISDEDDEGVPLAEEALMGKDETKPKAKDRIIESVADGLEVAPFLGDGVAALDITEFDEDSQMVV